ncbi:MAG: hypothetical protein ABIC95_03400 [archaeon]
MANRLRLLVAEIWSWLKTEGQLTKKGLAIADPFQTYTESMGASEGDDFQFEKFFVLWGQQEGYIKTVVSASDLAQQFQFRHAKACRPTPYFTSLDDTTQNNSH